MIDGNQLVKVVDELCRRKVVTFAGSPLSGRDHALLVCGLVLQGELLGDLLPGLETPHRRWAAFLGEPAMDVQRLSDTIKFADGVIKSFPAEQIANLCEGGEDGVIRSVAGFKHQLRDRRLYWGFMSPLETVLDAYFKHPTHTLLAVLNQWVNFLSHITLRDIDLKHSLMEEYVQLEQEELEWTYPELDISDLASIMEDWFSDFVLQDPQPSHGPGATAGLPRNAGRYRKYLDMSSDARLRYFLTRAYEDYTMTLPSGEFLSKAPLRRCSEIVCVPKSMTKNRTISKEPASLQYYQHAVRRALDKYFQGHPVLSGRIDLHHQEYSMLLAKEGSSDGSFATIDLSSASDSVTYRLIKAVFAKTPLLRPLVCLRSDATRLIDGRVLRLEKYAPMGSDLCFPTMCIVFSGLCELAVRRVAGRASRVNDYRVYGDDLVVRRAFVPEVLRLLAAFHFKVNVSKSFWDQSLNHFREACGGEYLDGFEVTPLRVPRRWSVELNPGISISSVEAVSSWVELKNSMFLRGYYCARRAISALLRAYADRYGSLPYTCQPEVGGKRYDRSTYVLPKYSFAILTHPWCCTNFRVPSRFSGSYATTGLHTMQFKVSTAVVKENTVPNQFRRSGVDVDDVRYFEYWLTLPDRKYAVEFGVCFAPEPITGIYPTRPVWRESWVSI